MNRRNVRVGEICRLNLETIGTRNAPFCIKYLDTSNITRNRIENIQVLDSRLSPFPSRAQRKVRHETIIYSTVRPNQEHFGFLESPDSDLIVSTGFTTIDVKDETIDPKYLYYSITRPEITAYLQTVAENNVSAYPSINTEDLANLCLEIPENLQEQKRIAKVLADIDNKIELNNKINAELEAMAKTLYDYWFVQFDFPDENGKPYKSSDGKMVWNEELKREIPFNWGSEKIGELCELYQPQTISEEEFVSGGAYLVYGANGIVGRYDQYNHEQSIVAVTCRGATCGNVHITRPFSWITGNAMVILPKNNRICIEFLYNAIRLGGVSRIITGSAQPQITRTNLFPVQLCLPEVSILEKFKQITDPYLKIRLDKLSENETLEEIRDWLLPMLMNGQVRVL